MPSRYILLTCLWVLLYSTFSKVYAQDTLRYIASGEADTIHAIRVTGRYMQGKVIVRWAPANADIWTQLQTKGYILQRHTLRSDGWPDPDTRIQVLIKPWPIDAFRPWLTRDNEMVLAAAQCLYGESEALTAPASNWAGSRQETLNRFGIALLTADLDSVAAQALGLRYEDPLVKPGQVYLYDVFPADTTLDIRHGSFMLLSAELPDPLPEIDHVIEGDGHVMIKWRRDKHEDYYSAYQIEYAPKGGVFTPLSAIPFVGGESDTYSSDFFGYRHEVSNYTPHRYRIRGLTAFGTRSMPSIEVIAQGRDRTPPGHARDIGLSTDAHSGTVRLTWKYPDDPDLQGAKVFASARFDGIYELVSADIIPVGTQEYQDQLKDTRSITYYKLAMVDTAGNMQMSRIFQAAFRDTIAPSVPVGLAGHIDSSGIVTLSWQAGHEPDLEGYRVYMANQADHFFTNMTPFPHADTIWRDTITLKTFTEEIYYRVAAVDFHSHTSAWSEPLRLSRPDTIRPMPPSFAGYRVEKDHILLQFTPGRSKDIVSHTLFRRHLPDSAWIRLEDFSVSFGQYQDDRVIPGEVYEYRLISTDDAGLHCLLPALIRVRCIDRSRPVAPDIVACIETENGIALTWETPDSLTRQMIVYRSDNGGPFVSIATLGPVSQYEDHPKQKFTSHVYKVKSVWKDGQRSAFSSAATPTNE